MPSETTIDQTRCAVGDRNQPSNFSGKPSRVNCSTANVNMGADVHAMKAAIAVNTPHDVPIVPNVGPKSAEPSFGGSDRSTPNAMSATSVPENGAAPRCAR